MTEQITTYRAGLDVGSTTAKLAVLDQDQNLIFSEYKRHNTRIQQVVIDLFDNVLTQLGDVNMSLVVTGSAGIGVSEKLKVPFVQEVIASTEVVRKWYPETGTLIDLGGEDSKMIFFNGDKAPDIRMNGSCAGGTGAFIDQMATLLNIPLDRLNELAENQTSIYPMASRCGVFAKTDVQNLVSRKIPNEDIIASVFHAVAVQALNTLSRAFDVVPKVIFSGGPFTFLPELRKQFMRSLGIEDKDVIILDRPELLPALGAAIVENTDRLEITAKKLKDQLYVSKNSNQPKSYRLDPLFESVEHFNQWNANRLTHKVNHVHLKDYKSDLCFLGIDSGSTTTKITLIGENRELLFSYYTSNSGNPVHALKEGLDLLKKEVDSVSQSVKIVKSGVVGYGEDLVKAALGVDIGVVETIAHFTAAKFFNEKVSFILDIGGQDMKAIFINDGIISQIELNESCSSGCGSFIETFGNSLGYGVADFAQIACEAKAPCDLGTRCTVFMNSKVKQSLRENAETSDIAAGLSISAIKNALFKVLKLKDMNDLGDNIVVQGGTFKNPSVHRALEVLSQKEIICPDVPELMGAFGAALIAQQQYENQPEEISTFIGLDRLEDIDNYKNKLVDCKGCENNCTITRFVFSNEKVFYSGNKCEKIFSNKGDNERIGVNLYEEKLKLLFDRNTKPTGVPKLKIGIPRVLNVFENYPFWNSLFTECGFEVVLSSPSSMKLYTTGQGTVMSDSICFPAKVVHGHIIELAESDVDRIFYPMVVYESEEFETANNSFNCPIVSGYPDVIRSAINTDSKYNTPFDSPAITFRDKELLKKGVWKYFRTIGVKKQKFNEAFLKALDAHNEFKFKLKEQAAHMIQHAYDNDHMLVVLAGRPYHTDRLINHKTPEILADLGVDVIMEDALPIWQNDNLSDLQIITQWAYPNRIFNAAQWVANQPKNVQLVQFNSFGCGPDAIVIDEVVDILKEKGKNSTVLRIDEITSTGSIRLRLRSMIESHKMQGANFEGTRKVRKSTAKFEKFDSGRTILGPVFSEIYSTFFPTLFALSGYKLVNLPLPDKVSVDRGLKYSNNEICYPATIVIGDIIKALQSGEYDRKEIAIGISQTGGQCRASSYISLIKKGMVAAGFEDVPVVAIGTGGITINDQPGFKIEWDQILTISFIAALFADSLSKMYYSTAVREKEKGTAKKLLNKYLETVQEKVFKKDTKGIYELLKIAVKEFNKVEVTEGNYPKIGIVGEIYVKYNAFGNHFAVDWLLEQGIEVVVPPLIDFFTQELVNFHANRKLNLSKSTTYTNLYLYFIEHLSNKYIRRVDRIMSEFKHYMPFHKIRDISAKAKKILSLVNQYGEGWLIPAEMAAFADDGVNNVVSLQPFGCIANHVISKGIEKRLRDLYPDMNVLYLDFDDGTTEVNMINRLHFMVKNVKEEMIRLNVL